MGAELFRPHSETRMSATIESIWPCAGCGKIRRVKNMDLIETASGRSYYICEDSMSCLRALGKKVITSAA